MKKLALLSLLLLGTVPLWSNTKKEKPNVLFVICDQWRRQSLGFLDEDPVFTPSLDSFAKDAVFFKHAYSSRPICSPNRASIFTGQYPIHHDVYMNNVEGLKPEAVTMGDVAKSNGYKTAYIGKWHMDGAGEGYVPSERRHGFDYWIMSRGHRPFEQPYYIQDAEKPVMVKGWEPDWITDRAIEFIDSAGNEPFFTVLSFGPPHTGGGPGFEDRWQPGKRTKAKIKFGYGYAAPKKYEDLYPDPKNMERRPNVKPVGRDDDLSWETIPGYFGAITSIDENFGRIIEYLKQSGKYENTIIVFTADHGEMLGSHGRMTKGIWYEESIGIPFLIAYPGKVKSREINNPFNSIDMMPTILSLAGMKVPKTVDGFDFSPLLLNGIQQNIPKEAYISFVTRADKLKSRDWWAILTTDYKLCAANKEFYGHFEPLKDGLVLYDLKDDPYEMHPIYMGMGHDKIINELLTKLKTQAKENNDIYFKQKIFN